MIMPRRYQPKSVRPKEEKRPTRAYIAYACGWEHRPDSFGMFAGPFNALTYALDIVPVWEGPDEQPGAFIIRFNTDGTDDKIYHWDRQAKEWVCMQGSETK